MKEQDLMETERRVQELAAKILALIPDYSVAESYLGRFFVSNEASTSSASSDSSD